MKKTNKINKKRITKFAEQYVVFLPLFVGTYFFIGIGSVATYLGKVAPGFGMILLGGLSMTALAVLAERGFFK